MKLLFLLQYQPTSPQKPPSNIALYLLGSCCLIIYTMCDCIWDAIEWSISSNPLRLVHAIYGWGMVKNGERKHAMNDQQHGSWPRHMTTDALFLAWFEKDLIRQLKINSAHIDNDATGCYDCIIVSLRMIACHRVGMPSSAIRTQAESLWLIRYAIKHAYGASEDEYQGTLFEPLFGTGQRSGSAVSCYLARPCILIPLLHFYHGSIG